MSESTVEMIPTQAWGVSSVGVTSEYPRGSGNYMSVKSGSGQPKYDIVNLSYEDMEDAKRLGIIGDDMQADVYYVNENARVAFVTDPRLPAKCLKPEWFYENRNKFRVEILRKKYGTPNGVCLCDHPESIDAGIFYSQTSFDNGVVTRKIGRCTECQKLHILTHNGNGYDLEKGETAQVKYDAELAERRKENDRQMWKWIENMSQKAKEGRQ
jgi:hypothetical protein